MMRRPWMAIFLLLLACRVESCQSPWRRSETRSEAPAQPAGALLEPASQAASAQSEFTLDFDTAKPTSSANLQVASSTETATAVDAPPASN